MATKKSNTKQTKPKKSTSKLDETVKVVAIGAILKDTWAIFKANWIQIYLLLALPFVTMLVLQFITSRGAFSGLFGLIVELTFLAIQVVVSMGILKGMLAIVRGGTVDLDTILSTKHLLLRYIWATFLLSLLIGLGFIFFIIPGIYFAIRYMFVPYLIVDQELTASDAMKESSRLTKGLKWDILAFMVITLVLGYSGVLLFVIGLLVTLPFISISYPVFYDRVKVLKA